MDSFLANSHPIITIAIACYNAESTIERAVRSALAQDWPNIEIVVVDDCSSDRSVEILLTLVKQDSRVRLIRHEKNLGVGAVRNTLVANSEGEYIAFFDDDDESWPSRLTAQYHRIIKYENDTGTDLILSFTARWQKHLNGKVHYEPTYGMDRTPGLLGEAMADLILIGIPVPGERGSCATCSLMAKRSVFDYAGGYDEMLRRGEDTEFNLRFALLGGHFAGLSNPLVTQHMTDSKDKTFAEERQNMFYWLEKHRDYLEERHWFEFSLVWFNMKFDLLEGELLPFLVGVIKLVLRYPFKVIQRISWSLPNLSQYLRAFAYKDESNSKIWKTFK